jgi:hypothetical protein
MTASSYAPLPYPTVLFFKPGVEVVVMIEPPCPAAIKRLATQ